MTTTITIYELLGKTAQEYEQEDFERYMRWCMSFAARTSEGRDLQMLLANTAISKYYNEHFRELESQFIAAITPIYKSSKIESIRQIYVSITAQIYNNYPGALFEEARNLRIVNYN